MTFTETSATFNETRTHRYTLRRVWDSALPTVLWVMLNPSTADEHDLDPTIRRCVKFSQRWGYGGLEVVNLFALRSTDPRTLYSLRTRQQLGSDNANDTAILAAAKRASLIIAGWGVHGALNFRGVEVIGLLDLSDYRVHCLGKTKDAHPRHPLYLRNTTLTEIL